MHHQHPRPIRKDLGSPDIALTISFIKRQSFRVNLRSREDICLSNPKLGAGSTIFKTPLKLQISLQPESEVLY